MKKTKILHLTTHINIGGITTYIYLLGRGMDQSKYELSVFSSGGEMEKQFHEVGIQTFSSPFRTKSEVSPKLYFAIPRLISIIKSEKIDLIHAHTRVTQVMAWCIQKLAGVPYVSTCHGFYKRRLGRRLLPAWGNRVIAISPPVADALINNFQVPQNKVTTILNAIDIENLEKLTHAKNVLGIISEYNLQTTTPVLGVIARVVRDKGHEYLIQACAELRKRYPDLKLLVIGEGPYLSKTKKLSHRLNLDQCVVFTGNLQDVTKALAVIDIFVLPAVWREGFGLPIVEAMALKKPVVATNIWALNSLIRNRINGLLVEPKSVTGLVSTISELIEDKALCLKIGKSAYETAKNEFPISRMAKELESLYQQVILESPKPRWDISQTPKDGSLTAAGVSV